MKLKLTYINSQTGVCIPHPHYDLHTDEEDPKNIACILTDKEGAKLIRKWIKQHNSKHKIKIVKIKEAK